MIYLKEVYMNKGFMKCCIYPYRFISLKKCKNVNRFLSEMHKWKCTNTSQNLISSKRSFQKSPQERV